MCWSNIHVFAPFWLNGKRHSLYLAGPCADLHNIIAAALDQLLIMGDHKNGSAAPRFAFQFFCDQAHILPVKAAGGFVEDQYPAAGKNGAGNGKALLLPAGQGRRVRVPVLVKAKFFQQMYCTVFASFRQFGIQQQLLRHRQDLPGGDKSVKMSRKWGTKKKSSLKSCDSKLLF